MDGVHESYRTTSNSTPTPTSKKNIDAGSRACLAATIRFSGAIGALVCLSSPFVCMTAFLVRIPVVAGVAWSVTLFFPPPLRPGNAMNEALPVNHYPPAVHISRELKRDRVLSALDLPNGALVRG